MYENKITKHQIQIKNTTPFIIGTGEEGIKNLQIQDGYAKIPATSIAGLFREFLKNQIKDEDIYKAVFLEDFKESRYLLKRRNFRYQSMLLVNDAYSSKVINLENDISKRTSIKINKETQTAEDKTLFETYYINEGKEFIITFENRKFWRDNPQISKKDIQDKKDISKEDSVDEFLYTNLNKYIELFIESLNSGQISIGALENNGFGTFVVKKYASREYNLNEKAEMNSYLVQKYDDLELKPYDNTKKNNIKVGYKISLACNEGMIVKGNVISEEDSNFTDSYIEKTVRGDKYIIPSKTLRGFLRSYFEKQISGQSDIQKSFINKIFGDEENKGKLKISDIELDNNSNFKKTRIQIDRFTGGAISGALITEQLVTWEKSDLLLDLSKLDQMELDFTNRMLVLFLQDMNLGKLSIGSGKTVGYGKLEFVDVEYVDNRHER